MYIIKYEPAHKIFLWYRLPKTPQDTSIMEEHNRNSYLNTGITYYTQYSHFNMTTTCTFAVFTGQWSTFLGKRQSVSCSVVSVSSSSCRKAMWQLFLIWCQDISRAGWEWKGGTDRGGFKPQKGLCKVARELQGGLLN